MFLASLLVVILVMLSVVSTTIQEATLSQDVQTVAVHQVASTEASVSGFEMAKAALESDDDWTDGRGVDANKNRADGHGFFVLKTVSGQDIYQMQVSPRKKVSVFIKPTAKQEAWVIVAPEGSPALLYKFSRKQIEKKVPLPTWAIGKVVEYYFYRAATPIIVRSVVWRTPSTDTPTSYREAVSVSRTVMPSFVSYWQTPFAIDEVCFRLNGNNSCSKPISIIYYAKPSVCPDAARELYFDNCEFATSPHEKTLKVIPNDFVTHVYSTCDLRLETPVKFALSAGKITWTPGNEPESYCENAEFQPTWLRYGEVSRSVIEEIEKNPDYNRQVSHRFLAGPTSYPLYSYSRSAIRCGGILTLPPGDYPDLVVPSGLTCHLMLTQAGSYRFNNILVQGRMIVTAPEGDTFFMPQTLNIGGFLLLKGRIVVGAKTVAVANGGVLASSNPSITAIRATEFYLKGSAVVISNLLTDILAVLWTDSGSPIVAGYLDVINAFFPLGRQTVHLVSLLDENCKPIEPSDWFAQEVTKLPGHIKVNEQLTLSDAVKCDSVSECERLVP